MLNEDQRASLWEDLLSAEVRSLYYGDLAATFHKRQTFITGSTLGLSSGAVLAAVGKMPELAVILPLGIAVLSIYGVVTQNLKRAIESADLHFRWNRIACDYQRIWDRQTEDDPGVLDRLQAIAERSSEASKAGTVFSYDEKRMARWQDLVVRNHGLTPA